MSHPLSNGERRDLRERLGVGPDDSSVDAVIDEMTPMDVVREYAAWHLGDGGWAETFVSLYLRLTDRENEIED